MPLRHPDARHHDALRARITHLKALQPDGRLCCVLEHILAGFQLDFPLVEGYRLVDVLTRNDFIAGLARHGPGRRLGDAPRSEFVTGNPRDICKPPPQAEPSSCPEGQKEAPDGGGHEASRERRARTGGFG